MADEESWRRLQRLHDSNLSNSSQSTVEGLDTDYGLVRRVLKPSIGRARVVTTPTNNAMEELLFSLSSRIDRVEALGTATAACTMELKATHQRTSDRHDTAEMLHTQSSLVDIKSTLAKVLDEILDVKEWQEKLRRDVLGELENMLQGLKEFQGALGDIVDLGDAQ